MSEHTTSPTSRIQQSDLPVVVVFYDIGSATAFEILSAARHICRVVFAYDLRSEYVVQTLPELKSLGTVCDITDCDAEVAAARLAPYRPAGVTTYSEYALAACAEVARLLGLIAHSPETIQKLTDKVHQRKILAERGVDTLRLHEIHALDDVDAALAHVGLPAVLKPVVGAGSRHTYRIDSPQQAHDIVQDLLDHDPSRRLILEAMLIGEPSIAGPAWGDYVSVESVVAGDTVQHLAVIGKFPFAEPFREQGMILPSTLDLTTQQVALDLAEHAVRALGVRCGLTQVELKLTASGPRILEINGRLGGYIAELLRLRGGVNAVAEVLRSALGLPLHVHQIDSNQVSFVYNIAPPIDAVAIQAIHNLDQLEHLDGITIVIPKAEPGMPISWTTGTQAHIAVIFGRAESHEQVLHIVEQIQRTLRVDWVRAEATDQVLSDKAGVAQDVSVPWSETRATR